MPGERRRQCREERLRDGVPLAAPLVAQLDKMAGELSVRPLRAQRVVIVPSPLEGEGIAGTSTVSSGEGYPSPILVEI